MAIYCKVQQSFCLNYCTENPDSDPESSSNSSCHAVIMDSVHIRLNLNAPVQPPAVLQQHGDSDLVCERIPSEPLAKQKDQCRTRLRARQSDVGLCRILQNVSHNLHCFSFSTSAIFWAFFSIVLFYNEVVLCDEDDDQKVVMQFHCF